MPSVAVPGIAVRVKPVAEIENFTKFPVELLACEKLPLKFAPAASERLMLVVVMPGPLS